MRPFRPQLRPGRRHRFFGPKHGLPRALCPHNSYWFWGPGEAEARTTIVFGGQDSLEEDLADLTGPGRFASAELAAVTECGHCMPFEDGRRIFVCRAPSFSFREIWAGEKFFY